MKGVMVYSGLVFRSIWSHSHDLSIMIARERPVFFLELMKCDDPAHIILNSKNHYLVPPNFTILGSKKSYKKYNLWFMIKTQFYTIKQFLLNQHKIDTLIIYNTYDLPVLLLAWLLRKKIVYAYVDDYSELAPPGIFRQYLVFTHVIFAKHCDKILVTAKKLGEDVQHAFKPIIYFPNTIKDVDLVKASQAKALSTNKFVVGFLGGLGHWVDTSMLEKAAWRLRGQDIEFWIVGSGPGTKDLENIPNIKLFGAVSHDKIYEFMKAFDIGLIPFKKNGLTDRVSPIKLLEYWACKLPVIATRTVELESHKARLVFATEEDLSKQILKLFKDKKRMHDLGLKGYDFVRKNTWEKKTSLIEEVLK